MPIKLRYIYFGYCSKGVDTMLEIITDFFALKLVRAIISIILALIADKVVLRIIMKKLGSEVRRIDRHVEENLDARYKTHAGVFRTLLSVIIYFFAALYIIHIYFNINASSVIAATGIVGVAVTFGAQSLIKDAISGFFVLLENQYSIGDIVTVENFMGTVEKISIRTTVIKNFEGDKLIIPNGNMTKIINHSKTNKSIILSVSVSYKQDLRKVLTLIEDTLAALYESSSDMLEPPKVLGVSELNDFAVRISMTAFCDHENQFSVKREILKEIKLAFDDNNIIMP